MGLWKPRPLRSRGDFLPRAVWRLAWSPVSVGLWLLVRRLKRREIPSPEILVPVVLLAVLAVMLWYVVRDALALKRRAGLQSEERPA